MAETEAQMEARLNREYDVYSAREKKAGREPLPKHRWINKRLSEPEPTPVTKKAAKQKAKEKPSAYGKTKTTMETIKERNRKMRRARDRGR